MKAIIHNKQFCILLIFILTMCACKKGDLDPSLSFRSRKNRIVNKWELFQEFRIYENQGQISTFTTSNNKMNVVYSDGSSEMFHYYYSFNIERNGDYSMFESIATIDSSYYEYSDTKGNWYFLNEGDGFKHKERFAFFPLVTKIYQNNTLKETKLSHQNQGGFIEVEGLKNNLIYLKSTYKISDSNFDIKNMIFKSK